MLVREGFVCPGCISTSCSTATTIHVSCSTQEQFAMSSTPSWRSTSYRATQEGESGVFAIQNGYLASAGDPSPWVEYFGVVGRALLL
eukprot:4756199-Alexandrium_andersonii.AAC.1